MVAFTANAGLVLNIEIYIFYKKQANRKHEAQIRQKLRNN